MQPGCRPRPVARLQINKNNHMEVFVTNQGEKSVCPYCNSDNLWDNDYVIREKGPEVASWYDFSLVHSVVSFYYVRCCEKCFKRRKRLDKIKNLMILIPILHSFLILLLFLLSKVHSLAILANVLLAVAFCLMPISILSGITSFLVYPLYNRLGKYKRVVSKEEAQNHNALFTYPISESSINQNILDPFTFGKVDTNKFEKKSGLSNNPHFYPGS